MFFNFVFFCYYFCFVRGNSSLFGGTAHSLPLSSLKQNRAQLEYTKEWKKGEIAPPFYVVFLPPPQGLPNKNVNFSFSFACQRLLGKVLLSYFLLLFFFFGGGVLFSKNYHPSLFLNLLPLLIFSVSFSSSFVDGEWPNCIIFFVLIIFFPCSTWIYRAYDSNILIMTAVIDAPTAVPAADQRQFFTRTVHVIQPNRHARNRRAEIRLLLDRQCAGVTELPASDVGVS